MNKWKFVEEIGELIDRAISDLDNDDADWVLKIIKDRVEELLED